MVPLDRFRILAGRLYSPGKEYTLIPHQERSTRAHGLFFKAIEVAWQNMPEHWQRRPDSNRPRFPTSTALRKWALVQEGFADEHVHVCDTNADAMQMAALARTLDEYAVIRVSGNVVTIWVAKTQGPIMGREEFNRSMDKVLGRISQMLGISIDQLTDNAKASMKRIKESS